MLPTKRLLAIALVAFAIRIVVGDSPAGHITIAMAAIAIFWLSFRPEVEPKLPGRPVLRAIALGLLVWAVVRLRSLDQSVQTLTPRPEGVAGLTGWPLVWTVLVGCGLLLIPVTYGLRRLRKSIESRRQVR